MDDITEQLIEINKDVVELCQHYHKLAELAFALVEALQTSQDLVTDLTLKNADLRNRLEVQEKNIHLLRDELKGYKERKWYQLWKKY